MDDEAKMTVPDELAIRLANSLTEFLDYFRANDPTIPRAQYTKDVIAAEKALADFDAWDEADGHTAAARLLEKDSE